MKNRQPTFIDILYPRSYPDHPKRVEATRIIVQPECDLFEQSETSYGHRNRIDSSSAQSRSRQASIRGNAG